MSGVRLPPEDRKETEVPRGVGRLLLAHFISVVGDRMFMIALSWWVVSDDRIANRELTLGLLMAATTLPIALAGPVVGPLIDRFDRRGCLAAADLARLALMALLAVLLHLGWLSVELLFAICIPLFFFEPLFHAAVSASIGAFAGSTTALNRLIAVEQAIPNAAAVIGTSMAALTLATGPVEAAFWLNAATFLISLVLVIGLPSLKPRAVEGRAARTEHSFRFLRAYPHARHLMILFTLTSFLIAPVFFYLPLLARDVLHGSGAQLGLLELGFALGNLLVFTLLALRPVQFANARLLRVGLIFVAGLLLGALGQADRLVKMLVVLTLWGSAVGLVTYLAIASFQQSIPSEFKGRFFALLTSLCMFGFPLSLACTGLLSSYFPLKLLITANAACLVVVSPLFLYLRE